MAEPGRGMAWRLRLPYRLTVAMAAACLAGMLPASLPASVWLPAPTSGSGRKILLCGIVPWR